MKIKTIILPVFILFCAIISNAQTWGCGERDLRCQMDSRSKALKEDPKNPENYYNMGLVFQRAGAHKEAIETFSMYVSIPGVAPEAAADGYNNRGISQRALKQLALAIADYTKAIELNPLKKSQFLVNRANANAELGDSQAALGDYSAAITADPKNEQPYAQRALLLIRLKQPDKALDDFAKSIELNPSYPEPYYNRAFIYGQKREFDKALADYDRYIALVKDPNYLLDGYLNRGLAYASSGKMDKAIADLTKAVELNPNIPNGYRARAAVYRQMKKNDLAEADEKKVAELQKSPR